MDGGCRGTRGKRWDTPCQLFFATRTDRGNNKQSSVCIYMHGCSGHTTCFNTLLRHLSLVATKARPVALARRSSHQLPAFVTSTKCFHRVPQARATSLVDRQRLRRAPTTHQSCHTHAAAGFTAPAPIAANAWRSSKGGLHTAEHRRQRCMFCNDARAPSSITGSRHSCDGSSGHSSGGNDDLSAGVLELEPLVERVTSALEQRCNVRGGDLVRMFGLQ